MKTKNYKKKYQFIILKTKENNSSKFKKKTI